MKTKGLSRSRPKELSFCYAFILQTMINILQLQRFFEDGMEAHKREARSTLLNIDLMMIISLKISVVRIVLKS